MKNFLGSILHEIRNIIMWEKNPVERSVVLLHSNFSLMKLHLMDFRFNEQNEPNLIQLQLFLYTVKPWLANNSFTNYLVFKDNFKHKFNCLDCHTITRLTNTTAGSTTPLFIFLPNNLTALLTFCWMLQKARASSIVGHGCQLHGSPHSGNICSELFFDCGYISCVWDYFYFSLFCRQP